MVSSTLAVAMNITLREVEGDAEIIVAEGRILLRVEHFEQRGGRIAVKAGAELVDLVEHHHGIARAGLADRLDDVARQRADIGAPMAADLRLVVHAAEAQAHEFAPGRARDALAERGLADARRSDEAEDRALAVGLELAHREIFEDAPLDLGQPVMILVQDAARFGDVDVVGVELRPGQIDEPIQIGADHAVFGGGLGHALEPLELLRRLILGLLRHARLFDRLAQLGDLDRFLVALAQLLLDVAQLLAQDVLALLRGQRLLRLLADLFRELEHLDALRKKRKHLVEPLADVDRLEHVLLFRRLGVDDAGDEIGKRGGRIQVFDRRRHFRGNVGQELDGFARTGPHEADARLDLGRHHLGEADLLDAGDQERKPGQLLDHAEAPHALHDGVMRPVGGGDVAQDLRRGAHPVQLLQRRLLDRRIDLQEHAERALVAHRALGRGDGRFAPDRQRQHDAGKQHELPHRQEDHAVGRERRVALALIERSALCLFCHGVRRYHRDCVRVRTRQPFTSTERPNSQPWSGSRMRRSKRPCGISKRWIAAPCTQAGSCRTPATRSTPRSSAISISWGSTPGSAATMVNSCSLSYTSTGGSQLTPAAGASPGWKKRRCNCSARSIIAQASAHIQFLGSAALMAPDLLAIGSSHPSLKHALARHSG